MPLFANSSFLKKILKFQLATAGQAHASLKKPVIYDAFGTLY